MTIKDASVWASDLLGKNVTPSNISYLIQYGQIPKSSNNGAPLVNKNDLQEYYNAHYESKEARWKKQLGTDLNWHLSFSQYKESETTKHVHRLHPYKGKFIPQLVEYFLDQHTDNFKRKTFFTPGDIILDPFCGSGTTLVQASELGLHALGIDVAPFNTFISNAKVEHYDVNDVKRAAADITQKLSQFQKTKQTKNFENRLHDALKEFNAQHFPSPDFKYKVRRGQIDEKSYGKEKSEQFLSIYNDLVKEYRVPLKQAKQMGFLDIWFLPMVRDEIDFVFAQIQSIENLLTKKLLSLTLSRAIRSCRATSHADLGTLKSPVNTTYYCKKHGKICKPLFTLSGWWRRYTQDTIDRIVRFDRLRTDTFQKCLAADSSTIDIVKALTPSHPKFARLLERRKIDGIFSSPPYVGLIDYHEQHAYAYDLLGLDRNDALEIGPLSQGQGMQARQSYVANVAKVLSNCKTFLKKDYHVFLVANDKYGLYPQIAELAGMKIVNQYKRPVLNRVEKDRSAYAETIFHLR